jgi:tetratricopeptide (TPR) repeat protein
MKRLIKYITIICVASPIIFILLLGAKDQSMKNNPFDQNMAKGVQSFEAADYQQAIEYFDAAHRDDRNHPYPVLWKGKALRKDKRYSESLACYRQSVALGPNDPGPNLELANFLATCPSAQFRDGKTAMNIASQINYKKLDLESEMFWLSVMGRCHAELGDFNKAVEYTTRLLNHSNFDENFRQRVSARLQSYKMNIPVYDD